VSHRTLDLPPAVELAWPAKTPAAGEGAVL